jgi:ketopantoate hydroxymethyltransferase
VSVRSTIKRKNAPDIRARKNGEPIVMLTSYHAHTAAPVDRYCDATAIAQAGEFSVVIEAVAEPLARKITETIAIPTIGIGANLAPMIEAAIEGYATDVRCRAFPGPEHVYGMKPKS